MEPQQGTDATGASSPPEDVGVQKQPHFKRKRYWVHDRTQAALLWSHLIASVFPLALLLAIIFIPLLLNVEGDGHAEALLYLHTRLGSVLLFAVPAVIWFAIRVSHRIAGPLVPIRRALRSLAEGRVPPTVRLRRTDLLDGEASLLNKALDRLREGPVEVEPDPGATPQSAVAAGGSTEAADAKPASQSPARGPRPGGFTLVELVIVVAILAALSSIGATIYSQALLTARNLKAVRTIKVIAQDIDSYRIENDDQLPPDLAAIRHGARLDPWGNPYRYLPFDQPSGRGAGGGSNRGGGGNGGGPGTGEKRKDRNLVPINTDYDLYSMGPDGRSVAPLTAAFSRDDIIRANDGRFVGVAAEY